MARKPELKQRPDITLRRVPADLILIAADIAARGIEQYPSWPGPDAGMGTDSTWWYFKATREGNVTVTFTGRKDAKDE